MCECSPAEQWLSVASREGLYEVSDHGRVRSLDRIIVFTDGRARHYRGRILSLSNHPAGYRMVLLRSPYRTELVHRLVLTAFVGPCPEGMLACHGPGGSSDNHLTNLRWDTQSSNMLDKRRDGTDHMVNRTHCPLEHLLMAPNLVPSRLPHRLCLACKRASGTCTQAKKRKGVVLDFRAIADARYASIMGSATVLTG